MYSVSQSASYCIGWATDWMLGWYMDVLVHILENVRATLIFLTSIPTHMQTGTHPNKAIVSSNTVESSTTTRLRGFGSSPIGLLYTRCTSWPHGEQGSARVHFFCRGSLSNTADATLRIEVPLEISFPSLIHSFVVSTVGWKWNRKMETRPGEGFKPNAGVHPDAREKFNITISP